MREQAGLASARPRVRLVGDPALRPPGLERALTRAGFQLVEQENPAADADSDAVLITVNEVDGSLAGLLPKYTAGSRAACAGVVIIAAGGPEAPAAALELGASDAMGGPIHLPELCARLHARIRQHKASASGGARDGDPDPTAELELESLDLKIRQEFERARRYSLSFSLVLLGIDALRGVEEREGPEAAQRLRRDVAAALRKELRTPDFAVIYGNDEFAILLPETGQAGARQSVMRVRDRLSVVPCEGDPRSDRPRFSAGVVTYPHPAVSQSDDLYALAEAALMRGRSQSGERIGIAV